MTFKLFKFTLPHCVWVAYVCALYSECTYMQNSIDYMRREVTHACLIISVSFSMILFSGLTPDLHKHARNSTLLYRYTYTNSFILCKCRYYAVEFNIELHAVSIRQKQKLLRQTRQWGEARLAVEGQSQYMHEYECGAYVLLDRI